jgi:predicted HicB family RNase H-like nuclease
MKETFKYKGFYGSMEFSLEDECLVGELLFVQSKIIFIGETVPELKQAFEDAVDSYLDHCSEEGIEPEKPLSGTFNVRISPELHKKLSIKAFETESTLNACVSNAIQFYLEHDELEQQRCQLANNLKLASFELRSSVMGIKELYTTAKIDSLEVYSSYGTAFHMEASLKI